MWIPPEIKDPVLLHHPTRRSVGYFVAVRLRDGRFFYRREAGRFNAVSFCAFPKELRRISRRGGRRVIVLAGNAKYHRARLHKQWRQEHQDHFALDYLPPHSPDPDPIERVWKLTRRQWLRNCYFPSLDEVVSAVESKFEEWASRNHTLRRLCAMTYCVVYNFAAAAHGASGIGGLPLCELRQRSKSR
jgi:transposase